MEQTDQRIRRHFDRGCVRYRLLQDGDHILVALSGGRDSLLLTRLLAQRARIHRPQLHVAAAHVVMDGIPYETDAAYLQQYCQSMGVELHILHAHYDPGQAADTPCVICARHRRRTLMLWAQTHGYNKVALGHHQDDILVTWLMNITHEGNTGTMMPSLQMEHYDVTLIRPLCLVQQAWIAQWAQEHDVVRQRRLCPYERTTRRTAVTALLRQIEAMNPEARYSMWHAMMAAQPGLPAPGAE